MLRGSAGDMAACTVEYGLPPPPPHKEATIYFMFFIFIMEVQE